MSISRQWKKIKKEVERAVDAHDGFVAYMQIDFGRFGSPVSKQSPDCPGTPPASMRWVAKMWRRLWGVAPVGSPAFLTGRWEAYGQCAYGGILTSSQRICRTSLSTGFKGKTCTTALSSHRVEI